ncbi:MAG: 23S rRNA (cytidine(2498)-2'-O)-methyltransferase RlmM [Betaproteobacteria bacterium]
MEHPASAQAGFSALLLYCRAGFEKETAQEISAACAGHGVSGFVRSKPGAGYVEFVPHDAAAVRRLMARLRYADLVFARQLIWATPWLRGLPAGDRLSVLLPAIVALGRTFGTVWLETADTNEAKELVAFCRQFAAPLEQALRRHGLLRDGADGLPRLHLFFADSTAVCLGTTVAGNASPWPMGVPRLRLPPQAPSRSTLKLAEALQHWLGPAAETELLHEGTTAVDLGAAPGGWTWQLVRRGVQVIAVDNGPLAAQLLESDLVEHVRADGFRYRPPWPVGWMVCDMVEQPLRVAVLVADWLADGRCGHSIFNLKLPMKKRYEEVARCRGAMRERWQRAGIDCSLQFKHLYHDREEITGYAWKTGQSRKKRSRNGD